MINTSINYIKDDWKSHPVRLILETINWFGTVALGLIVAITVPNVPFGITYPIWLVLMVIGMFSAISRGSSGLFLASLSMFIIDIFGYVRFLLQ